MKNSMTLAGISLLLAVPNLSAATHYVALESTNPRPPYSTWSMAATNIQDAVNAAATNDVVMVTSGVYPGGVTVTKSLTLMSVTGPQFTVINGGGTIQCISLADGASLTGFTLTNGYADPASGGGGGAYGGTLYNCTLANNRAEGIHQVHYDAVSGGGAKNCTLYDCTLTANSSTDFGGGAYGCTLYNCTLTGNSVYGGEYLFGGGAYACTLYNCTLTGNSAEYGGGAYVSALNNCTLNSNSALGYGGGAESSTLTNCTLTDNEAYIGGGGADYCTLNNCTLTGNSAEYGGGGADSCTLNNCTLTDNKAYLGGGGADSCTLYNCIVAYNAAWTDDNYTTNSTLNYCCTTPLPANGFRNISVPPQFVDYASGNLHLQSNSPCINAGANLYVTTATDLDGNPRVVGDTVDLGAYEFQKPTSILSYAWAQEYGLPTDGSADFIDSDHDGVNNWQEYVCGTCPSNAQSVLRLVSVVRQGANVAVTWQSVVGINYFLECGTNLTAKPCFICVATNLAGQPNVTCFIHTNVAGAGPRFYRVGASAQ